MKIFSEYSPQKLFLLARRLLLRAVQEKALKRNVELKTKATKRRFEQKELCKNEVKLEQIGNETNTNKGGILSSNDNCFLQIPRRKCTRVCMWL